jgi:hypothetical protein
VRFYWFRWMAYPDLPDDFQEKHRSVWVNVPRALSDPEKGHWPEKEHWIDHPYLDQSEVAGGLGLGGIGVTERPTPASCERGLRRRLADRPRPCART